MVLAIDPGYTTGIAWFDGETMDGQELVLEGAAVFLYHLITRGKPAVVVCETFRITAATAKNTQAPWSLELIGAVRLACELAGVPLKMQAPGEAKGFATDDKLQALGWYNSTKGGHRNDATRHLLVWLVNNGWWDPRLVKANR